MKKFESLGRSLSKEEQKKVMGGLSEPNDNTCNAYCGTGSNVTCSGKCPRCEDAGNGANPNKPGGDKMCF